LVFFFGWFFGSKVGLKLWIEQNSWCGPQTLLAYRRQSIIIDQFAISTLFR